jgi:diaminohydroxyphosphoribosylaminopyrimidine deaminase/5-amino-6-(5-phosphoribosylamino)uracil reductase
VDRGAPEDNTGWISSEQARLNVQRQRHAQDAIWTGIGTVLVDDPLLTDRSGVERRRQLLRVVMDSTLRLPVHARMLQVVDQDLLVICGNKADNERKVQLEDQGVEVIELGDGKRPELGAVLEELGRREMTSVLLEAGAELNGAALEAGVVDKLFLYYAPKILAGGDGMPMAAGRGVRDMSDAMKVRNSRVYEWGENFAVEGYLRDVYRNH